MHKIKLLILLFLGMLCNTLFSLPPDDLITSPERYIQYKKDIGLMEEFTAPYSVIIVYQATTLKHLQEQNPDLQPAKSFNNLYVTKDGSVGVLGGWGIGAPAIVTKIEQLAVLGTKRFIGVGTAGGLLNNFEIGDFVMASKALGEDGVAHLYLDGPNFVDASSTLNAEWNEYASDLNFHEAGAWSFPALFRERYSDVIRVTNMGCGIVEMETATLFAVAQERGVDAIALYVVSDTIGLEEWVPRLRDPQVVIKTNLIADKAFQFCQNPQTSAHL